MRKDYGIEAIRDYLDAANKDLGEFEYEAYYDRKTDLVKVEVRLPIRETGQIIKGRIEFHAFWEPSLIREVLDNLIREVKKEKEKMLSDEFNPSSRGFGVDRRSVIDTDRYSYDRRC